MPKVISTELLDQIGRPDEMVDDMLDRQIEALETQLGLRDRGVGNRVLELFLVNGTRIQLSQTQFQQALHRQVGLDEDIANRIIRELTEVGILRVTSAGRYEIANSFLARRAFQKVESENRVLRTIRATIQDRMTRDELLDRQYLNYIGSSLPLLDLSREEKAFVERSRDQVRRRRRRINWALFGVFLLLGALATNSYLNYRSAQQNNNEYLEALNELNIAKAQEEKLKEDAQLALEQAQEAREEAVAARQAAEVAQQEAERNAREAERQRILADALRAEAEEDRNRIFAQSERLRELSEQALRDAERKEQLLRVAETSERLAQEALNQAEVLNRIITSWNAATRALEIEDARTKALVTLEAYKLNRDNPAAGDIYHPSVVRALQAAAASLDEKLQYGLPSAHGGAIRDIIVHPDGAKFYTTGSDGKIRDWEVRNWNLVGLPDMEPARELPVQNEVVYNLLALSPDGQRLLSAGESRDFHVFSAPGRRSIGGIPVTPPDEIFSAGFTAEGDFLAAGFDHFYRYDSDAQQLQEYPKQHSNKSMVIKSPEGAGIFSIQGQYQDYAYALRIDSLGIGGVGSQEINFFGTPREVDYGPVSKTDYGQLNDSIALWVLGFTSGRIMFIETDARGDRFLPRNADSRKEFKQHQAAISDFAFSRDGKKLAVASYDGTVSVWDLQRYSDPSYQPVILDRHSGWVLSVAFAHNDEFVISGCQDGSLYFWNVNPTQYAKFLCQLLEATGSAARQEQLKLERISRKSGQLRAFDELSGEDYRRYFGEAELRRVTRQIRVCE